MAGKITAENTFGNVLICLRLSKLNYVVKETPYSAYVTIKKKFIKSYDGEHLEKDFVEKAEQVDVASDALIEIKQKVNYLEKESSMLRYENEEREVKYKVLKSVKIALEDQIEELLAKGRGLVNENETLIEDNNKIKKNANDLNKIMQQNCPEFSNKKVTLVESSKGL